MRSAAVVVVALGIVAAVSGPGMASGPCRAVAVEYAVAANLKLSETPLGQGDGVYRIGPGRLVLRFQGDDVTMTSYVLHEHVAMTARALFWKTTLVMDARSSVTPDACSVAAEGRLEGRELRWRGPVSGLRTDGTLTCDGAFCGRFGAPPAGRSPLHAGPMRAAFNSFVFAPDMKTFTMATTAPVRSERLKVTSEVAMSGREIARRCVDVPPCPGRQ